MNDVVIRLEKHVVPEPNTGCWLWDGTRNGAGYGVTFKVGTSKLAHRVLYELMREPVPTGLDLDHICRNRGCVNPWHLEAITHRENILRGTAPAALHAKKTHCPKGHEYAPENTRLYRGSRYCKACTRNGRGSAWRANRTNCPNGHAFDADNTLIWNGQRCCRTCRRAAAERFRRARGAPTRSPRGRMPQISIAKRSS
jgi:hypothetical protein